MGLSTFLRNFIKFLKGNLFSLAGLSIGMMVTVYSVTYIAFESSYDRFHKNHGRIYQVSTIMELQSGNEVETTNTYHQLKEYIDLQLPQIESTCRIRNSSEPIVLNQEKYKNHKGLFVDKEFFSVFDFKMLVGDGTVIENPNSIILCQDLAEKLFGDINCLGKTLGINGEIYSIRGIIEDPPGNTSVKFDYLIPINNYLKELPKSYSFLSVNTFFRAREEFEDFPLITGLIDEFFNAYNVKSKEMYSTKLRKLTDINQYSNNTSRNFVLFISISVLVLLVSIVNFVNAYAAGSELRMHETGIRKVVGASRILLIRNMLFQSVIFCLLAAIIGLVLSELFIGSFRTLSEVNVKQYGPGLWWIQIIILFIALFTGCIAGIFPAIRYSSLSVISMVRCSGEFTGGSVGLRKILVIFQYIISAGLLICIFIFLLQLRYLDKKDPGYEVESRMLVEVSPVLESSYNTYIGELRNIPGIITVSGNVASFGQTVGIGIRNEENGEGMPAMCYFVEDNFFKAYGINVQQGRTFSQTSGIDTGNVIIDAATVGILGLEEPLGKKIKTGSSRELEIIGVVDNTDLIALKGERTPFLYTQFINICSELIIHYQGDPYEIAERISASLIEFDPEFEYNFRTVKEAKDTLYTEEKNQVKIVLIVCLIAVIITIIGAYSMAAYMAEYRARQVSIRKVMGATISEVLHHSFREIILMIIIAYIVASPLAYFISSSWLENFTQRIVIGPLPFILSIITLSTLIFITVFFKERKAAMVNPVKNLRQE
ncbi:MAG: FtsX-like permease family protein [Bacteroidia bacterium]|nr:MAG: FtsX-like permease family protein [Bacteroidia bacterium]